MMHLSATPAALFRRRYAGCAGRVAAALGGRQQVRVAASKSFGNDRRIHTNFLEKPDVASHNPVRCRNATMAWPGTEFPDAKDEAEQVRRDARGFESKPRVLNAGWGDAAAMAEIPLSGSTDGRKFTVDGRATVFNIGRRQNAVWSPLSGYPAQAADHGQLGCRMLPELDTEMTDFIPQAHAWTIWSCKNINAKHPPSVTPAPILYQYASSRGGWVPVADPCTTLNKWSGR